MTVSTAYLVLLSTSGLGDKHNQIAWKDVSAHPAYYGDCMVGHRSNNLLDGSISLQAL